MLFYLGRFPQPLTVLETTSVKAILFVALRVIQHASITWYLGAVRTGNGMRGRQVYCLDGFLQDML